MNNKKYINIFLFVISIVMVVFVKNIMFVSALTLQKGKITSVSGNATINSLSITSNTCTAWKKKGDSCKIAFKKSKSGSCNASSGSITFKSNTSKTINVTVGNSGATASTHCNYIVTAKTGNFDDDTPQVTLSEVRGNCVGGPIHFMTSGSVTCVGNVTLKVSFHDNQSGMSATPVSTTCASNDSKCCATGSDKVGHNKKVCITIKKDREKCSATTINITNGVKHNGKYGGNVTCTAKCTRDNLAVGGSNSTTVGKSATSCTAKACDAAGNCTSKTIPVPRDTTKPKCSISSFSSDGKENGYLMGRVYIGWTITDKTGSDFGFTLNGFTGTTTRSDSTNDNKKTSFSGPAVSDYQGNSVSCPGKSYPRDTTAPSTCKYWFATNRTQVPSTDTKIASVENTQYSNSSVHASAQCTSDGQSGCSPTVHEKDYRSNGTHSGQDGIGVYDKTEHYSASPKNVLMCSVPVRLIDQAAPTCSATLTVANPSLSSDKTRWTTNTWHNNQDKVYDVNGNIEKTNSAKRVQAYLKLSNDNATSGGDQSGIKSGFKGGTAMNNLADEARTTYNDGSENGIYTVFVRDRVYNVVNNSSRSGWSGSTLYAHGVNTTGNVGSCSANVYSFDNTKPIAHIKLSDKTVAGNYDVWDNNSKITMSAKTVNNNINSVTHWSSVDVYFKIWGTDPNGGKSYNGNEFQGRSGIKKVCYRLTQNSNHADTAWTCYEPNDQRDGSYSARSAEYLVPANTFTGITTIEVKVQDWAGNWSDVNNSQKVYIDTTRPTAKSDSTTSKNGFTEVVGTQNYNSMKNPIYPTQTGLDRPWVSQFVNSTFKGQDNTKNQYSGSYQFGYYWSTVEYNVQYADNQPYLVRADNSSRVNLSWNYFGTKTNANDKTAGIKVGTNTEFSLPTISNPAKTDYYWLYVRACDNVEIGPRNCQIYKSKLVRFDNDQPSIDSILDVTNNESDTVAESAADGHGWTNKLKLKIKTSDKPVDNERSQVAYISYKWNTNYDSKDDDKNSATFDSKNTAYTDASTPTASLSESDWTYVKCSAQDSDANLCTTTIDFNKFVKGTSPVHEGYRFLKVAIVDKAGNVSGDNGIVYGPYKFDITPPEITGLEFRGHRADNNAEINYNK